ncbi:MAG: DMT family transporter [Saprospiraceae bacterium]|nr:DMT family transporter [Saprospiraceae bacterium]
MVKDDRNKGILLSVLAALLWSTGGLLVKVLPQDAFTILFYRSLYTSLFFLLYFGKKAFKINKRSVLSACFYAPLLLCFVSSTKMTTAANAIFLQSTGVAYVLLLEPLLLKTKLLKIDILTVILSFVGMALFLIDGFEMSATNPGIYIAMLSGLALAGILISQKSNAFEYQTGGIFLGNIFVLLITSPWFFSKPLPTFQENAMLLFLGFVQLGLGFLLFTYGQKYITAIEGALISLLEPLFNPLWVMIGYGEVPGLLPMTGGLIIIGALVVRLLYLKRLRLQAARS